MIEQQAIFCVGAAKTCWEELLERALEFIGRHRVRLT